MFDDLLLKNERIDVRLRCSPSRRTFLSDLVEGLRVFTRRDRLCENLFLLFRVGVDGASVAGTSFSDCCTDSVAGTSLMSMALSS